MRPMKLPDNVILMPISGDAIRRMQARELKLSTYAARYNWESPLQVELERIFDMACAAEERSARLLEETGHD